MPCMCMDVRCIMMVVQHDSKVLTYYSLLLVDYLFFEDRDGHSDGQTE